MGAQPGRGADRPPARGIPGGGPRGTDVGRARETGAPVAPHLIAPLPMDSLGRAGHGTAGRPHRDGHEATARAPRDRLGAGAPRRALEPRPAVVLTRPEIQIRGADRLDRRRSAVAAPLHPRLCRPPCVAVWSAPPSPHARAA